VDQKELKELSMFNLDKVLRALDKKDIEEARKYAQIMEEEAKHAHDLMVEFVYVLLSYIGKNYGEEEVVKAMRSRHGVRAQVAERMLGMKPEDAVRFKTMVHRGHHSQMTLTEEEERFVLKLDPCNTGGRLFRDGLDQPPFNLGKFRKKLPETWNQTEVPYYCGHCAMHAIMGVQKGAPHPTWVYRRPRNPQDPCYQYCYKRTRDVPEEYFNELGLKKPREGKKEKG
jgi:hypothetical protein